MSQQETGADELDRIFDVLSQPFRRRILTLVSGMHLQDDTEFALDDLVTDEDDAERRSLNLFHVHLPMLEDAGYVTWDRDEHTIRRGPRFDDVASVIRLMQDHQNELPGVWP